MKLRTLFLNTSGSVQRFVSTMTYHSPVLSLLESKRSIITGNTTPNVLRIPILTVWQKVAQKHTSHDQRLSSLWGIWRSPQILNAMLSVLLNSQRGKLYLGTRASNLFPLARDLIVSTPVGRVQELVKKLRYCNIHNFRSLLNHDEYTWAHINVLAYLKLRNKWMTMTERDSHTGKQKPV